jgi:uncharacterized protein DUF6496
MAKYGKKAQQNVKETMHAMQQGKATNGRYSQKVTGQKQTVTIGLSRARKEGAKVPQRQL